jgi:hypothetical protein
MVNVVPRNDEREHQHDADCWCQPRVEWLDDDGQVYPNGPLIVHNAEDGREFVEKTIGEMLSPEKDWAIFA